MSNRTLLRIGGGLARYLASRPKYDLCFAGFYGQPLAIALAHLQKKPIVLDAYVSTYDTLCMDRGWFSPTSLVGKLAFWLDRRSCQIASRVITDTQAHRDYFVETFGIPRAKITPVYVGCDETLFFPRRGREQTPPGRFEVFYYGAFLPLHGTEIIVEAAALLQAQSDIHVVIGGSGPLYRSIQDKVRDLKLNNVDLIGWIPMERLPDYIERASICLGGHFSDIPKAARVISTKTFQFIAMQKPTIVADNAATRELFVPDEHVVTVPMNDPVALAAAIQLLANNPSLRRYIAHNGYSLFQERLTIKAIAAQLRDIWALA